MIAILTLLIMILFNRTSYAIPVLIFMMLDYLFMTKQVLNERKDRMEERKAKKDKAGHDEKRLHYFKQGVIISIVMISCLLYVILKSQLIKFGLLAIIFVGVIYLLFASVKSYGK